MSSKYNSLSIFVLVGAPPHSLTLVATAAIKSVKFILVSVPASFDICPANVVRSVYYHEDRDWMPASAEMVSTSIEFIVAN